MQVLNHTPRCKTARYKQKVVEYEIIKYSRTPSPPPSNSESNREGTTITPNPHHPKKSPQKRRNHQLTMKERKKTLDAPLPPPHNPFHTHRTHRIIQQINTSLTLILQLRGNEMKCEKGSERRINNNLRQNQQR